MSSLVLVSLQVAPRSCSRRPHPFEPRPRLFRPSRPIRSKMYDNPAHACMTAIWHSTISMLTHTHSISGVAFLSANISMACLLPFPRFPTCMTMESPIDHSVSCRSSSKSSHLLAGKEGQSACLRTFRCQYASVLLHLNS